MALDNNCLAVVLAGLVHRMVQIRIGLVYHYDSNDGIQLLKQKYKVEFFFIICIYKIIQITFSLYVFISLILCVVILVGITKFTGYCSIKKKK